MRVVGAKSCAQGTHRKHDCRRSGVTGRDSPTATEKVLMKKLDLKLVIDFMDILVSSNSRRSAASLERSSGRTWRSTSRDCHAGGFMATRTGREAFEDDRHGDYSWQRGRCHTGGGELQGASTRFWTGRVNLAGHERQRRALVPVSRGGPVLDIFEEPISASQLFECMAAGAHAPVP